MHKNLYKTLKERRKMEKHKRPLAPSNGLVDMVMQNKA